MSSQALMARLRALPVATKLTLAFATLLVLTAALGSVGLYALSRVNADAYQLAYTRLPAAGHLAQARVAMLEARDFEVRHTTAEDAGYMDEYGEKTAEALKRADESLAAHAKLVQGGDEATLRQALDQAWAAYRTTHDRVLKLGREGQQQDARDISEGAGKSGIDDTLMALDRLSDHVFEQARAAGEDAQMLYQQAQRWMLAMVGAALISGSTLAVVLSRSLLRQLGGEPAAVAALLRRVADGDLTQTVPVKAGDTDSVMACVRDMQAGVSRAVASVRQGSQGVAVASAEIAHGNSDLSSRTEQQASFLQQTAASMEQLGSTVTQNAEHARQANELAQQASEVAGRGGEAVNEVVSVMRDINDSSRRIADITGVIDSIAFQTNILALNAAVEAARAGEQGRGFAVVAGEVRSLAQRSATAAKEIKSLISASVEQIQRGSHEVDRAGSTMSEVVQAIQRVSDIVSEISVASNEQSEGVGQVGQAIMQMDHGTQQNAALVEQSAAAAESLRQQADALVHAVAVFRIRDDDVISTR